MSNTKYKIYLSIIIPAFNEEAMIYTTIKTVCSETRPLVKDFEIIVVDDGSTDSTKSEIQRAVRDLGSKHKIFPYYSPVNFGKGAGIRLGYMLSKGEVILIQDADLELTPKDYPALLLPIKEKKSRVVYGSRFLKKSKGVRHRTILGNKFVSFLVSILFGVHVTDVYSGFKVMESEVAKKLKLKSVGFEIEPEITIKLVKLKEPIYEVPVRYAPRNAKLKKIKYLKDGLKFFVLAFRAKVGI